MTITSMLAIYLLFWVMTAFVVLPFGVKTHDELGMAKIPGQADSAPGNFRPLRMVLITTAVSAAAFVLYYCNYTQGWLTLADIDLFGRTGARN